jgi:hypothetical protein
MPAASGVFKRLSYKVETTYGVAPTATGAQQLRRVSSDLSLVKDTYQSAEIRTDQQVQDMRHGAQRVEGTIEGELSPGTYADFMDAALRRARTVAPSATGLSITVAGSHPTWTITRSTGSWLTDGFKRGHVVRLTAGAFNAANLNKNMLVTGITATVLTVRVLNGTPLTAQGPIATATCAVAGRISHAPTAGHTNVSFAIEHWHPDVPANELFLGCQPTGIELQLPAAGLATVSFNVRGQGINAATAAHFTTPTVATSTGLTAAVNGFILIGGEPVASVTGLTISLMSDRTGDPVVGSNVIPTLFPGRITCSGQMTAQFDNVSLRDAFINELEVELVVVLTVDNGAAADFVAFTLPRVKVNGSTKSDGEGGLIQTVPFVALLPYTGGAGQANELTTFAYQDSAAA